MGFDIKIISLSDSEFNKVEEHKGLSLLVFYAEWCNPCHKQKDILDEFVKNVSNNKYDDKIKSECNLKFFRVNIDVCKDIALKFSIQSIPTLILFKDGKEVFRHLSVKTEEQLVDKFVEYV